MAADLGGFTDISSARFAGVARTYRSLVAAQDI